MPRSDCISLLLPTRNRPVELARALASAAQTARQPDRLEAVLYLDEDDRATHGFACSDMRLIKLVGPRICMGAMTRACHAAATGEIVMLANDDVVFGTPGWDDAARNACDRFVDRICLAWGNDGCTGLPAHPWLSQETCRVLGGLCPANYHREFIDTHLHDIFRRLRRLGHDRLVYLPDVSIEHRTFFAGKAAEDETYKKPCRERDELKFLDWAEERDLAARRLARAMATQSGARAGA